MMNAVWINKKVSGIHIETSRRYIKPI